MKIVRSIVELERLGRDRAANGLFLRTPVAIEIPGLARDDQIRIEQALNRYQTRCGCVEGAIVMMASLVLGIVWVGLSEPQFFSFVFLGQVIGVLVGAFVLGFAGKIAAMAATRVEFARACEKLARAHQGSSMAMAGA